MTKTLTIPPTVEPLTIVDDGGLEEFNIKRHLHISLTGTDDDDDLGALIQAAREFVEQYLRRSLITQTWVLRLDAFPPIIVLPRPPTQSATLKYRDGDNTLRTLDVSKYDVDTYGFKGSIIPAFSESWPITRAFRNAVEVTFVAGYGDAQTDIPAPIIHAMKLIVGHYFENRELSIAGTIITEIPFGVERILSPYKVRP